MKPKPDSKATDATPPKREAERVEPVLSRDEEREILIGIIRSQLVAMYEISAGGLALIGILAPTRDAATAVEDKIERAAEAAGLKVDRATGAMTRVDAGPVFGRPDPPIEKGHESRGS